MKDRFKSVISNIRILPCKTSFPRGRKIDGAGPGRREKGNKKNNSSLQFNRKMGLGDLEERISRQ